MGRFACLALALCLLGCAGGAQWSKDGASPEQAAADLADCRSAAQTALRRDSNIDTDILATRGRDWQNTGALSTMRSSYAAADRGQSQDIVSRCMIAKGYAPGA